MSKFIVKNGQFWLDDHPQLIQAGEFHYFRTPREKWRHRLGLLKAAGFNAVASYIPGYGTSWMKMFQTLMAAVIPCGTWLAFWTWQPKWAC